MTAVALKNFQSFFPSESEIGFSEAAENLLRLFDETRAHLNEPVTAQGLAEPFNLLDRIYIESAEKNWDGYGAEAVSPKTYASAYLFLQCLPPNIPAPDIIPMPDGDIGFDWRRDDKWSFIVSIGQEDILAYAGLLGKDNKTHGTHNFSSAIPKSVINNIVQVCAT